MLLQINAKLHCTPPNVFISFFFSYYYFNEMMEFKGDVECVLCITCGSTMSSVWLLALVFSHRMLDADLSLT